MMFNFDLNVTTIILLSLSLVCAVLVYPLYMRRITRVSRYAQSQTQDAAARNHESAEAGYEDGEEEAETAVEADEDSAEIIIDGSDDTAGCDDEEQTSAPEGGNAPEPASIIVYAQDEAENLMRLLPQLLKQKYEPGFEIIVVNEGESEATTDVVDNIRMKHKNVYLTFTPDGARNLSRKKLALMLGIKAAQNRVVVNTLAGTSIESVHWLSSIMRHFTNPETEVVLGYAIPIGTDTSTGKRRRAFDAVAAGVTWLTSAIAGRPYRGTEYNLAYTRDIFFRNKGFSRSLNLRYGDDDIFVSEIANGGNTAVELSAPSIVKCRFFNHKRAHTEHLRRHEFTGRYVRKASRRLMAAGAWLMWACIFCALGAGLTALPNLMPATAGLLIVLVMLTLVTLSWRGAMRRLRSRRKMLLTLPYFALTQPMRNTVRAVKYRIRQGRNYTWK